jgi:hypothetical protein
VNGEISSFAVPPHKGPGHEYDVAGPPLSVPPAGASSVSSSSNALTGRIDIFRDGLRIATAKTSFHAGEVAAAAAGTYANPWKAPLLTTFQAPSGT